MSIAEYLRAVAVGFNADSDDGHCGTAMRAVIGHTSNPSFRIAYSTPSMVSAASAYLLSGCLPAPTMAGGCDRAIYSKWIVILGAATSHEERHLKVNGFRG